MIRPRWQKVIADLWGNRTRSILVVASIAVGLFALGVIATIYAVSLDDMRRGYAAPIRPMSPSSRACSRKGWLTT